MVSAYVVAAGIDHARSTYIIFQAIIVQYIVVLTNLDLEPWYSHNREPSVIKHI